jgi:hypothetical protein
MTSWFVKRNKPIDHTIFGENSKTYIIPYPPEWDNITFTGITVDELEDVIFMAAMKKMPPKGGTTCAACGGSGKKGGKACASCGGKGKK